MDLSKCRLIARTLESSVKLGQHVLCNHACSGSMAERRCGNRANQEEMSPSRGDLVVAGGESGPNERRQVIQGPGDFLP